MELIDLLIEWKQENEKYFLEPKKYTGIIKNRAVELFGDGVRTYLFGSVVKGNFTYLSDIDILILAPRLKPGLHAEESIYLTQDFKLSSPFQIILCNEEQFEEWYKPFFLQSSIEI